MKKIMTLFALALCACQGKVQRGTKCKEFKFANDKKDVISLENYNDTELIWKLRTSLVYEWITMRCIY